MSHTIQTTHIQKLIDNAAGLAEMVDGKQVGDLVAVGHDVFTDPRVGDDKVRAEHALCKAISDLRHAADELDAERLSCFGWVQR